MAKLIVFGKVWWYFLFFRIKLIYLNFLNKYQPSGEGGTCSPPATPHRPQHLIACLIQNGWRCLEIGPTAGYWTSDQLLLNRFVDSIIPSVRTSKIQNGRQGIPKWPPGTGKRWTPRFLGASANCWSSSWTHTSTTTSSIASSLTWAWRSSALACFLLYLIQYLSTGW